jgi:signal transduction histidine kinase
MFASTAPVSPSHHSVKLHELGQQLGQIIRTSANSPALLSDAADLLVQKLPGGVCLIVAGTGGSGTMATIARQGSKPEALPPETLSQLLGNPFIQKIFSKGQTTVISDLQTKDLEAAGTYLEQLLSVRAFMGTATYFRQQSNGLILIGSPQPRQWRFWERQLLNTAAESLVVTFSLIQLQEQAKTAAPAATLSGNPALKAVEPDSHPIFKAWYEATRQRTNAFINNFITTMSDQTRNPLSSIKVAMQLLRQKNLPEQLKGKYLDILSQEWQKLNDINNKILTYKKLSAQELTCHTNTVNLDYLIGKLAEAYQQQQSGSAPTLTVDLQRLAPDSPLTLHTDAEHLTAILQELLTNARKFCSPGEAVSLEIVEPAVPQPQVTIAVSNPSSCFPPDVLKYFFDPFYREQSEVDSGATGIGLGLAIVKGLVELLGGKIEVTCTPREAAEDCMVSFKLTLPR